MLNLTTIRRLALTLLVFLMWTPAAYAWSWPVQGPVLQPFSYDEAHPYAAGQHRGIDIGAGAAGETVVAPAAGTVSFAGTVPTSGKSVTIVTDDGYSVTLTHLGSILVAKGAAVAEQDAIGAVGPSGTAEVSGPYVHLGIRLAADPNGYVDPLGLLPPASAGSGTEDDPAGSQSSSGGGSSTASGGVPSASTSPAATSAGEPPASEPVAGAASTGQRAKASHARTRASSRGHGRAQEPVEGRSSRSPRRPEAQPGESIARTARSTVARGLVQGHSTSVSQRPVVETAAPVEPTGLGGGHELARVAHVVSSRPQEDPASFDLLGLCCNGAAALVAVGAAFAAGARRRRNLSRRTAGAQVVRLPRPTLDRGLQRAA